MLKFLTKPEKALLLRALEIVSLGAFNVEVISAAGIPSTFLQTLHLLYFHPNEPSMTPTIRALPHHIFRSEFSRPLLAPLSFCFPFPCNG